MNENLLNINEHHQNQRIDNYLFFKFKFIPKTKIYSAIRKGEIRINSKRAKASSKLNINDIVRVPPYFLTSKTINEHQSLSKDRFLPIIFEDDDFIVVDKPAGISAHSGTKNAYGVIEICREQFKNKDLDLCHRIDRSTSGIILLSKNKSFLRYFHDQLMENQTTKEYLAIVHGDKKEKIFTMNNEIELKHGTTRQAISEFKLVGKNKKYSLYLVKIETGRMHQIRIHCLSLDMPIVNDKKYGNAKLDKKLFDNSAFKEMGLHAYKLAFKDRLGKENIFYSDITSTWSEFLSKENIVVNL